MMLSLEEWKPRIQKLLDDLKSLESNILRAKCHWQKQDPSLTPQFMWFITSSQFWFRPMWNPTK